MQSKTASRLRCAKRHRHRTTGFCGAVGPPENDADRWEDAIS